MANRQINVPVSRAMRDMTMVVKVTGVRTWLVRLWFGTHLIRLAAFVIGCGVRVDVAPNREESK